MVEAPDFGYALVLDSDMFSVGRGSVWEDSDVAYPFPSRYLRWFEPLERGEPILAVVYEPRGRLNVGRMAYVAWTILENEPSVSEDNWLIQFSSEPYRLQIPVPREMNGVPVESWLSEYPRGRLRNSATRGRAVRQIPMQEAIHIIAMGDPSLEPELLLNMLERPDAAASGERAAERRRVHTTALARSGSFRRDVIEAYGGYCAVTGLGDGSGRGLEAAHIQAAGDEDSGPDIVTNGICLTPTIHRLFDLDLLGFRYEGQELRLCLSSILGASEISNADSGVDLVLIQGKKIQIPSRVALRPDARFVEARSSKLKA
jgi:putative restriction endonuclease